jgi:hypothetical protein
VGDRLGVARRAEDGPHAARGHPGEEVLDVEAQHDAAAGVQRGVGRSRPAGDEAVRRGMRRDAHEELVEHEALRGLQPRLRPLDHAHRRPVRARDPAVAVVAQPLVARAPLERADVGQPRERPARDVQELRQICRARERRHAEAPAAHRGGERSHPDHPRRRGARRLRSLERGGDERGEPPRRVERRAVVRP